MSRELSLSVAPTLEPISFAEAKVQIRSVPDSEKSSVELMIGAVRSHVESFTRRQLVNATYTLKLGVEELLKREFPDHVKTVVQVN